MKKIKVKDYIDKNCKKCHGRGYIGFTVKNRLPFPCNCVKKNYIKRNAEKKETNNE